MDLDQFEMLLGDIYESAWSTAHRSKVLNRLAQMTDCTIAHLHISDHRTRRILESYCGGNERPLKENDLAVGSRGKSHPVNKHIASQIEFRI